MVVLGDGLAGLIPHLQRPEDALFVAGVQPCGAVRVDGLQLCQQRADALLLQPLLQTLPGHTTGASGGKVRAADQGLQIQPRAAHQNRAAAPAEDILHTDIGLRYEPGHGPALGGIGHPHHVVGDALHLLRSGGGGADGHAPIDLHGVRGHHLAAEAVGQRHAHFRFSRGGGTHHTDDLRDHRGLLSRSFFLLLPPEAAEKFTPF